MRRYDGGRGGRPRRRSRPDEVIAGVRELVDEVRLEVLVGDGTRLVVLVDPLGAAGRAAGRDGPGAIVPATRRPRCATRRPGARSLTVRSDVAAGRPGLVALPVRPGQLRGWTSIASAAAGSASTSRRRVGALGAGRDADGRASSGSAARRRRRADDAAASPRSERLARYGPTTGDRSGSATPTCGSASPRTARRPATSRSGATRKTLRPRMTQRAAPTPSELDAVVAGALVIDPTHRRRQGRHRDQGRPDRRGRAGRQPGDQRRDRAARSGRTPQPIMGYGLIATPGRGRQPRPPDQPGAHAGRAVRRRDDARSRPASRSRRGRWSGRSRRSTGWPLNVGLQACARSTDDGATSRRSLDAGASASRSTRTTARTPELIDATLAFADAAGVAVSLHTDGLHEAAELEDTVAAIAGRTVHAYHVEGTRRRPRARTCSASSARRTSSARRRRRPLPFGRQRRGRARPDDRPQPRRLVGRRRRRRARRASGSTRRRWRPRARSTSSARSRSSTPTRRGWAGSWRRSGGRFSLPA